MKKVFRKHDLTELVFILDRSGSMAGLEEDTIGGFNGMIDRQKAEPGECAVTTVLFDNRMEVLHDRLPLAKVAPMTRRDYFVRGTTALMDAVGIAIDRAVSAQRRALPHRRAGKVVFVIITDGLENASRIYSRAQVRQMIEYERQRYGWEFLFLGANIDAEEAAAEMGIAPEFAADYHADSKGTALNYQVLSETVSHVRMCGAMPKDWKRRIDEDFRKRSVK